MAVLEKISKNEPGSCDAVIFTPFGPDAVSEVIASDEESAAKARKILERIGKILPVSVGEETLEKPKFQDEPELPKPSAEQQHFSVSDRVTPKPRLNNPSFGTITDVSEGVITVQWDHGNREIYDIAEALMKLMTIETPCSSLESTVIYKLPGMEESAAKVLSSAGIDPVTIYSLASFAKPPHAKASGWEKTLSKSLSSIGLNAKIIVGYLRNKEGKIAFSPGHWVEAKLPGSNRLVIEMTQSGPVIHAGRAKDYVVPGTDSHIILE
jgi:hypothetical protein